MQEYLQSYELILTTKSPVHIGSGKTLTKKEYLFDAVSNQVSFLDEERFFAFLIERGLTDAYEDYIMYRPNWHLDMFLKKNNVTDSDIRRFTSCKIDAGDAVQGRVKGIQQFVRNGCGEIYVPGSSIKGALRLVLLKELLLTKPDPNTDRSPRGLSMYEANHLPNSLFSGLRVSDSTPISQSQMCLTQKIDDFADGTYTRLNICRECLIPDTEIRCVLTLDQSVLHGRITKEHLERAIATVSEYYQKTVLRHYPQAVNLMNSRTLLLGGGVGYQSKTVTDPFYGAGALKATAEFLDRAYRKHNHMNDIAGGVAPRALKQTEYHYDGRSVYPYGVCEVSIR